MVATAQRQRDESAATRRRTRADALARDPVRTRRTHGVHLHPQVDPVEQGTRQLAQVAATLLRRARAVPGICGRTQAQGIGGQRPVGNEPETRPPVTSGDADFAVLQAECAAPRASLTRTSAHASQKQHPSMRGSPRPAGPVRTTPTIAATLEKWCGAMNGGLRDQRRPRREQTQRTEWMAVTSSASLGRSAADPEAAAPASSCPQPGGPVSIRVMGHPRVIATNAAVAHVRPGSCGCRQADRTIPS